MANDWFRPQLITSLRQGYDARRFFSDVNAGFAVAVLALPLSLAIAIASGAPPAAGIVTTVIAGVIISACGGTKHQIGGPAAAFIVVVAGVVAAHGFHGLAAATMIAGGLLVVAAILGLGSFVKHIPHAVITGFMSGVGVVIALNQLKDLTGIENALPAAALAKVVALGGSLGDMRWSSVLVGLVTMGLMLTLRRLGPRFPVLVVAVAGGSLLAASLGDVATIQSRFGALPQGLPAPQLPTLDGRALIALLPTALVLTFLIGVESLLSAVIADSQSQARDKNTDTHNPNAELAAQGFANLVTPLFGGMPATGVIARSATNIGAGAETPIAGILHAAFVGLGLLFLAPLAERLALPCLAGVLLVTAWRLLEFGVVKMTLTSGTLRDRLALATTWVLTVFVSLEIAIAAGLAVAYVLRPKADAPGH